MNKPLFPLTVLCAFLTVLGCQRHVADDDEKPEAKVEGDKVTLPDKSPALASIASESVQPGTVAQLRLNGRLVWNDDLTVRVFAPFAGRVDRILAENSQTVAAGDTLALIASPDYAQAQADAAKAGADFALAGQTLERLRTLLEHGAVAQKDVQAAEADLARARSEKERAEAILRMQGGSVLDGQSAFALKSPIGGVVVEKNINPGQEVRPDQMLANAPQFFAPLFVVSDPTRLWILIDATDQDLPALHSGVPLEVRSPAFPDKTFTGQVDRVSDSLDPNTRMVTVRGHVDNPERLLKAEMFVAIGLDSPSLPSLDVAGKAVFMKGGRNFVYVELQPGAYQRREVQIGVQHGEKIAILHGLQAGERVVTEGGLFLDEIRADAAGN